MFHGRFASNSPKFDIRPAGETYIRRFTIAFCKNINELYSPERALLKNVYALFTCVRRTQFIALLWLVIVLQGLGRIKACFVLKEIHTPTRVYGN